MYNSISKFLILSLFSGVLFFLFAADNAEYRVLGFSKDAKYFAYEVYGQYDGSGAVYSYIHILEVQTGKECVKSFEFEDYDNLNLDSLRIANLDRAEEDLDRLKLNEDTKGTVVFKDNSKIFKPNKSLNISKLGLNLSLELTKSKKMCFPELESKLVKLSLIKGKNKKVLFEEKKNSRLCVNTAKIERVVSYKDALICIIAYTSPGFEGFDTRQLFITTTLK